MENIKEINLFSKWDKFKKKVLKTPDLLQKSSKSQIYKFNKLEDPLRRRLFIAPLKNSRIKDYLSAEKFQEKLQEIDPFDFRSKFRENCEEIPLEKNSPLNISSTLNSSNFLVFDQLSMEYKSETEISERSPTRKASERTSSDLLLLKKKESGRNRIYFVKDLGLIQPLFPLISRKIKKNPLFYQCFSEKISLKGAVWGMLELDKNGIRFKALQEKRPKKRPYM